MSADYSGANSAMDKYKELQDRYTVLDEQLARDIADFKRVAEEETGEAALRKAEKIGTEMAQKAVQRQAGQAATQAQTAARQAGLSKSAAAMAGAQQAAGQYGQNIEQAIQGRTQQAYSAGQDRLAATQARTGLTQGQVGNIDTRTGQRLQESQINAERARAEAEETRQLAGMGLQTVGTVASMFSDERLKNIFGEVDSPRVIELVRNIDAIDFEYTPEAQEEHKGECNMDGDEHIGVSAQQLEKNPLTQATVEEIDGDKVVNTAELTMVNTAVISSLAKEIAELKDMVRMLSGEKGGNTEELMEITTITEE